MNSSQMPENRSSFPYILLFTFISLCALFSGMVYYQNIQKQSLKDIESRLTIITELKKKELLNWRNDRLEHGKIISRISTLSQLVNNAFIAGNDPNARLQLNNWFVNYSESFHYDQIRLLDVYGNTLMSLPDNRPAVSVAIKKELAEVVKTGHVSMVDFYRNDQDRRVYLSMLVPIRSEKDDKKVIGILALRIDPEIYIYPLLRFWSSQSKTAETLLVRRDGDDLIYLNDLKFAKDSALNKKLSLKSVNLPAVKAILGEEGIVEGIDYRTVPVIACLQKIPDTPWFLVSKIDKDEAFAPLADRRNWLVVNVTLIMICFGAAFGLLWRQQRVNYYRSRYKIEKDRAWLQTVIDKSLNEIYVFDSQTLNYVYANNGALQNIGYSLEEIVGVPAYEIMPDFTRESFQEFLQPLFDGSHERLVYEASNCRKDGSIYPTEVSLQLSDMSENRVYLAVIDDITERKKADDEIRQKNTELERFTYTVSHDLKSPLITIKSFAGSIKRDLTTGRLDRVETDLDRIASAADKMTALLEDLLELSRIGRIVNSSEQVAMNDIVSDVQQQLAGLLGERQVKVEVMPDLPVVTCDRQRITEVVQNLLENAVKYMGDQNNPYIRIGVRRELDRNVFFVSDNGIGVDEKFHQNIFGLFNKLDSKSDGTGIGLSLVKRIVEVHGGTAWVESAGIGSGSTFCFTLA